MRRILDNRQGSDPAFFWRSRSFYSGTFPVVQHGDQPALSSELWQRCSLKNGTGIAAMERPETPLSGGIDDVIVSIRSNHHETAQAALFQPCQEVFPCLTGLIPVSRETKDFALSIVICSIGNHQRLRDNPAVLTYLEIRGVDREERIIAFDRPISECLNLVIEVFADIGNGGFRDRCALRPLRLSWWIHRSRPFPPWS